MHSVFRICVATSAAALAACAGQTTSDISVADHSTFIPSARVAVDITGNPGPRSEPHSSHAVELGATGTRGSDRQHLAAGERPIRFGGQIFDTAAAQDLRHRFNFHFVDLAYRYRKFFGSNATFGVEGLGGLGYAHLGLTVSGATQRASESLGDGGIVLGVGGIWRFRPTTSLQARLAAFGTGRTEGVTNASRFDLYVAQALGSNAAVRAGVASWGVNSRREDDDSSNSLNSPIHLRFSGVVLGLDMMF